MQRLINRMNALHYDRNFPVTTIVNGAEQNPPNQRIIIRQNTQVIILQQRAGPNWQNVPGAPNINLANVTAFVNFIRNGSFPGNHRNVLTNSPSWRAFYHVAARGLTYLDNAGAPLAPAPMGDTVPCFDCGLTLPLRNITIDHQRPQGGNRYEPICKVFRAVGLTVDGPGGPKGGHYQGMFMAGIGGIAGAGVGTLQAKFTLNNVGKIYYSLADWCGTLADQTLELLCMDHLVNLRPLCNACNTPNRNVRHF